MKTLFLTLFLLALALLMLGVKVLFVPGAKFPDGHAHNLEERRRQARAKLTHKNSKPSKR